jgi:arylsulfatase A-like enzyme
MSSPKSLVLVTVDCMRADHAGFLGYSRPTTPFLDELSGESFVAPNSVVTGAPTYFSFPGIMASRFPLAMGRDVIGIAPGEVTLASVLKEAGYSTAAILAANPYLSSRFGYEQGFDVFLDHLSADRAHDSARNGGRATQWNQKIREIAEKLGAGRAYHELYFQYCQRVAASTDETWDSLRRFPSANTIIDEACGWLATVGHRPFFLWLHLMDPHAPYYPTSSALQAMGTGGLNPAKARYLNESWNRSDIGSGRLAGYRDDIVRLYDAGIRCVDTQLARLAEELKTLGVWESCLFTVTADHGEEFLDHGGRFHSSSSGYREMLHVPLLVRAPGVTGIRLQDGPFSLLHLAPSLLEAIGVPGPAEFEGQSYWRQMQRGESPEVAVSESVVSCTNPMRPDKRIGGRLLVVKDRRWKLIVDCESQAEELFDLAVDPAEEKPLPMNEEKSARAKLLSFALEHLNREARNSKKPLALRAKVHQIGLELRHSENRAEVLA